MKSLALIGLAGLAANVQAHPTFRDDDHSMSLSARGLDLSKYEMPPVSSYSPAEETKDNKAAKAVGKRQDYVETATEFLKKEAPGLEFRVVEDHYVSSSGVAHVNFKQTHHGIDIDNADFKVNVGADGKIFSFGNNFFSGQLPKENPVEKREHNDPVTALKAAVNTLGLPVEANDASAEATGENTYTFKQTSGAVSDPEARLVYFSKADGSVALTWRVETDISENWLLTYVNANDANHILGVVDYASDFATMEVFPWNVVDPSDGGRQVVEDPWDIAASPFTWFGDGSKNYTTTWGNNGAAQSNPSGKTSDPLNNYRPDSPERKFEYEYSDSMSPDDYVDFSITQLFYTANNYHDVLYNLGFDESAGNFQVNNNGKGGRGNDFVILNTQDGSGTNNANFLTPPDGSNGRMRMYVWTRSTPNRDSSLDTGVVIHEFTHGLSTRLTGGPANSGCLRTSESGGMGEGWSDFMAVAYGTKASQDRNYVNNFGSWISNKPTGIRKYPYSTSMTTNPHTYAKTDNENGVHAIGNVWASVLYEVLWNLIDTHGNKGEQMPAFNNGVPTDGRFLAMKLVLDGMALQPCSPTMPQARDAIIDADKALTGGKNACDLWKGFAKRGLGEGAAYGSRGRTESFKVPSGVC